jgi:hypothetical protein
MIHKVMDEIEYRRRGHHNWLRLRKHNPSPDA